MRRAGRAPGSPPRPVLTISTFAAEEIPDDATEFKCAPPIRDRDTREDLWHALRMGWIEMIVSDHSPAPPNLRLREIGDFFAAWGGIASLQLRLPAVWTEARARGFSLDDVTALGFGEAGEPRGPRRS